ncbi:MAG: hypothetical protein ACD_28C00108G0025 [uncultured bacterium]|nr:MAG: hypothetical protein ACD_28C00108G0025 [uncultured bacterium]KKT75384.1 MAG: hypothetical protein UW70_C0035G0005 [Candidatus Peregrinibacteria bacterium GW2011_GWA2_44_7]
MAEFADPFVQEELEFVPERGGETVHLERTDVVSGSDPSLVRPQIVESLGQFSLDALPESFTRNVVIELGGTNANRSFRGLVAEPIRVGESIFFWPAELQQVTAPVQDIVQISEREEGHIVTRYVITTQDQQEYELRRLDLVRLLKRAPMLVDVKPPLKPLEYSFQSRLNSFLNSNPGPSSGFNRKESVSAPKVPSDFLKKPFTVFIFPTRVTYHEDRKGAPFIFESKAFDVPSGTNLNPIRTGSLIEFYREKPRKNLQGDAVFSVHPQPRIRRIEVVSRPPTDGPAYRLEDEWGSVYYFFESPVK